MSQRQKGGGEEKWTVSLMLEKKKRKGEKGGAREPKQRQKQNIRLIADVLPFPFPLPFHEKPAVQRCQRPSRQMHTMRLYSATSMPPSSHRTWLAIITCATTSAEIKQHDVRKG